MRNTLPLSFSLLLALPVAALAQTQSQSSGHSQALIRNALSAAPAAIAAEATVVDFQGNVLRPGTNGFVCLPDNPDIPNNSPMCLDATWREVIDALMNERRPDFEGIGISYMLQSDLPTSNIDPYATEPTDDNEWIQEGGPHIMVVVSDQSLLEGLSTDPDSGGPFVMWRDTPYAHIMIPTVPRTN